MLNFHSRRFHSSFVTRHALFVICHSSFVIRYASLLFLFLSSSLFAQPDASRNIRIKLGSDPSKASSALSGLNPFVPVTINPGVPVTLTAEYGLVANEIPLNDNGVSPLFEIEFPFIFFGDTYSRFFVGANGWISFDDPPNSYWGARRTILIPTTPIQDPGSPQNCILGAMEDYDPGMNGGPYIFYRTIGDAPNRKLVVMWCQCPMVGCTDSVVTFQIVLLENGGAIENHILKKPKCDNWDNKATLGIQKYDNANELFKFVINRNAQTWSVFPSAPEAWQYSPTTATTYDVSSIPFVLEPITPGDKIEYRWYEGSNTEPFSFDQTVVVVPNETTTYLVSATICNGETFTETVTVTVEPDIPNAFAPNSIAGNDKFDIKGIPHESITKYNIKIYNRWGQMVFISNDIEQPWDGSINNNEIDKCPEGVYVWVIYYENVNKTKVTNKGTVTLFR